jgi:hypothetical protein
VRAPLTGCIVEDAGRTVIAVAVALVNASSVPHSNQYSASLPFG